MPEFKKNLNTSGTGFRMASPEQPIRSVETRTAGARNQMLAQMDQIDKQRRSDLDNMAVNFLTSSAKGYSQAQADNIVGADEEGVSQIVSESFSELQNSQPSGEVSAEEVQVAKDKFLQDTLSTQARIQAAIDQGILSSAAGNARMQALRKEKLANPIVAMFQKEFDQALFSQTGAGARNAVFGKTQAEKDAEARSKAFNDASVEKELAITQMVDNQIVPNYEAGERLYNQTQANSRRLQELQTQEALEGLGEGESVELYQLQNNQIEQGLARATIQFIQSEGTADDEEAYNQVLGTTYQQQLANIERSDMLPSSKEKYRQRAKASFEASQAAIKDNTFTARLINASEEVNAQLQSQGLTIKQEAYKRMPTLQLADVLSNGNGQAMKDLLMMFNDRDNLSLQFKQQLDPVLKTISDMNPESQVDISEDAVNGLIGGDNEGSQQSDTAAGYLMNQKGVAALMGEGWKKTPEKIKNKINRSSNISLLQVTRNNEFRPIIQNQPDLMDTIINRAGREAMTMNMGSNGSVPNMVRVTPVRDPGRRVDMVDVRPSKWEVTTGGVEVTDKYKEQVVNAWKIATMNPKIWEGQFDSVEGYLTAKFTTSEPALMPAETTGEPEDIADAIKAFAPDATEGIISKIQEMLDSPPSIPGISSAEAKTSELLPRNIDVAGEPVGTLMEAIAQVETGGESDPFVRTRVTPKGGSTAYGPLQVTKTLVDAYLRNRSDIFTPEEVEYLERFQEQAEKFNEFGNEPDKEGYDARYDYGGQGELNSEADRNMYWQVFSKMFTDTVEGSKDLETVAKRWHGGKDAGKIKDYANKLRSTLNR